MNYNYNVPSAVGSAGQWGAAWAPNIVGMGAGSYGSAAAAQYAAGIAHAHRLAAVGGMGPRAAPFPGGIALGPMPQHTAMRPGDSNVIAPPPPRAPSSGSKRGRKGRTKAKRRTVVPHRTDPTRVHVHCVNMCGVLYCTKTRDADKSEWTKVLRRLNAHESKRCRRSAARMEKEKALQESAVAAARAAAASATHDGAPRAKYRAMVGAGGLPTRNFHSPESSAALIASALAPSMHLRPASSSKAMSATGDADAADVGTAAKASETTAPTGTHLLMLAALANRRE